MTIYLELGDYCEIAAELLGTTPEQIAAGEATPNQIIGWLEERTAPVPE